ncbi:MAG: DMT family transporter, partial [Thermoleophilaceae bacterium]|nr:DMT family transporter [Thermoleophilaceae bacterium]
MSRRSLLALLFLGSLWGASYMFIKIALDDLSPAMVVFARTALAALVLVPLALRRDALGGLSGALGVIVLLAVVQVSAPFLLISAGEQEISSSLTGILISSTPLFTALLAIWVDHEERSTGPRALGLVAGFLGVALLIGVDLGGSSYALLGGIAVALAGLGYAIGSFVVKRSSVTLAPIGLAAATMTASAVLTAPLAAIGAPDALPSLDTVGAMLALGLVGTGVAFAIFNTLIVTIGPARVALVTYIAPVFAVFYGSTLLGETVSPATLAGLVLIVGGSWIAAGQGLSRPGRRPRPAPAHAGA